MRPPSRPPNGCTLLHPLECALDLWVSESSSSHSSSLLQDLGYTVLSLHAEVVQESICCVTLHRGGVQGRHTSHESGFSVCPSEKWKSAVSAFLATVQPSKHLPLIHAWFDRFPLSSSALSLHPFLSPHGCLPYYPMLHGQIFLTNGSTPCGCYLLSQPSWWTSSLSFNSP